MRVGAVIVAAGMSTRMDDFKQLMKIGNLTMVERVVINFLRTGVKDIVMVTGYRADEVEKSLRHFGITFLRNEDYETTQTVKNISKSVINESGKTASDTVRDTNPFTAEDTEADTQTQ